MSSYKFLLTLILVFMFAASASGQSHRASVLGTVKDPNGALVPGATVTLTNEDTDEVRTENSGAAGEFTIASVPPGRYQLRITATSFRPYVVVLTLRVNQELRVDSQLEVPPGGDIVVVTIPELKKDSSSISTGIENRQVVGLPLDGRNFYELTLLVPGAAPAAPGSAGSVRGDFAFSVNGAREDSNNFLLDGVYNVDPKLNTFGVRPSVDAIREFDMLTSSYDAAFGRNPGAQVNVVLKSERTIYTARCSSFIATELWTRGTSSPRAESLNQSTSGTNLAVRSAARSKRIRPSGLPTMKAFVHAKVSLASRTYRPQRNAPVTFRKACSARRLILSPGRRLVARRSRTFASIR